MAKRFGSCVQWRAWVLGVFLCGAASLSSAQTSSLPSGATPNWTPGAAVTQKAAPAPAVTLAATAPTTTVYYDTSLTACPAGSTLDHFWHYQDTLDFRGSSWCGAAQADINWANANDTVTWRIPYRLEQCVAGSFWTYSHAYRDGSRYFSPPFRQINMTCTTTPVPPPPPPFPPDPPVPPPAGGGGSGGGGGCKQCPCGPDGAAAGNPILPATGDKVQTEGDYRDAGEHPLDLARTFRSSWIIGTAPGISGMGPAWRHRYAVSLLPGIDATHETVRITFGDGSGRSFSRPISPSGWAPDNSNDGLSSDISGYTYRNADDDSLWRFDSLGRLLTHTQRNGWVMNYSYNASGQLAQVTNQFGRAMTFAYNAAGLLQTVTPPDGQAINYTFDSEQRLSRVDYPDGKFKTYLYENPAFAQLLTGIVDENGTRFASFAYDTFGRAISTEHAGGVEKYTVDYGATPTDRTTVTDPLGTPRGYGYSIQLGKLAVTSADKPSASGFGDAASRVQNSAGLIDSETDFLGYQTLFTWDAVRRVPTSVTRAAGQPEAQTVNTQWHPSFRLPTRVTETGRTTEYTYDSLGNKLSETMTDSAPGPTQGVVRTTAWTYNAQGLVETETAPNGAVSRFAYDTTGNLVSSANALRHTTTFVYGTTGGSAGRVTQATAPTGLVTRFTHDPRGRVLSIDRGGEVTAYTYTPSGQLASTHLPGGHEISYRHDAAQRLTGWVDNRGAVGSFTLDNMGNRAAEEVRDALGNLVWRTARTINTLNRVQGETTGANLSRSYSFDANGSLRTEMNGLSQATLYGLDGLRRLTAITNAANASASLQYNALDAVTRASDFKGVATAYARDALGNAAQEASPDTGARTNQYDSLGLPTQLVDALGQATQIQRDLLGRPTLITWADGKTATLSYDRTGTTYNAAGAPSASKGYLSEMVDRAGTTRYLRDIQGRVLRTTQIMTGVSTKTANRAYVASGPGTGELDTLTYGSGGRLKHLYNAAGQLVQLNWNDLPLVTDITWNALGLPTSWNWAFTATAVVGPMTGLRSYDTAGRVTATEFSSYQYDPAGRITAITQQLWKPANSNPASTAVTTTVASFTVGYDALGRIQGFTGPAGQAAYTYDANGNRLSSVETSGSGTATQSVTRNYQVDATSNRLLGFTQQLQGPGGQSATSVQYGLSANGELLDDGLRRYRYDPDGRLA
ncbi:MAG: DUF6531 domain-containing protein, partial [Burkholderiales bacterium]|nr:DUF6531 domain-containing protein [Burkholderiales bacterium]